MFFKGIKEPNKGDITNSLPLSQEIEVLEVDTLQQNSKSTSPNIIPIENIQNLSTDLTQNSVALITQENNQPDQQNDNSQQQIPQKLLSSLQNSVDILREDDHNRSMGDNNFSQGLIKTLVEKDQEEKIFNYYLQILPNLQIREKHICKLEIMKFFDSSISEIAKRKRLHDYYLQYVQEFKLDNLIKLVNKSNSEILSFIKKNIIPEMIPDYELLSLYNQILETQAETNYYQKTMKELNDSLKKKQSDLKQLKFLLQKRHQKYQQDNKDKIALLIDIGQAFVKIIKYAILETKI